MDKVVIELDEKYRELVKECKYHHTYGQDPYSIPNSMEYNMSFRVSKGANFDLLLELSDIWFKETDVQKTLERIHSADEIVFVEAKHKWRLKKDCNYAYNGGGWFGFESFPQTWWIENSETDYVEKSTESEFKQALKEAHCPIPFDKWEGVEV